MAAANTYGVTPATLQAFVADLTIDSASSPSEDDVESIIAYESESLRGYTAIKGITTDGMTSTDPAYSILAKILIDKSLAAVLRAKNRGIDAEGYAREAGISLDRLLKNPQSVDATSTADLAESTSQWADRTGAERASTTWRTTTNAGRIVSGGSL